MSATYAVELWDHGRGPEGCFSGRLAARHLAREVRGHPRLPAAGLSARDAVRALRKLRSLGWDDAVSIYVSREDQED